MPVTDYCQDVYNRTFNNKIYCILSKIFIMAYKKLFSPIKIGSMELKNRLVMPPMVRNYASLKGLVTEQYLDHIESIAKGGVGMLILEASYITEQGKGFLNELGIHNDKVIPGLNKLAKVAHKHKAKIGIQLYHAGRQTSSATTGMPLVAPSPIPCPLMQGNPKQLTKKEIKQIVQQFADAAARAQKAGLDFVELHGAHGYLITQFLSPFSNKRKDEYGGSFENRFRFAKEIVEAVRAAVGDKYPVTIRLSADEMVPGGLRAGDVAKIAAELEKLGVDAIHISVGNYASYAQGYLIPPMVMDDGLLIKYAQVIKEAVNIPVITVGKIRTAKMGENAIKKGYADMVAIGRTLLADPEWPNKVKNNQLETINPCIACNQGCIQRLFSGQQVWCTTNPATAREKLFKTTSKKKRTVVIIGGGPAGLSAARTAASRGDKVILFEKNRSLGGQLPLAAAAPNRPGWEELLRALIRDVKHLGVAVKLGIEPTADEVKQLKPNQVIIAVGSSANQPKISGLNNVYAVNSRDVLSKKFRLKGAVVVVGGGCAGAQTAEYIADKHHKVTIIEMGQDIALDAPLEDRALLLGRLAQKKVKILTKTMVIGFEKNKVIVLRGKKKDVLPAKTVVLCLGSHSNNSIAKVMKKVCKNVVIVGDARKPRRVTEAMIEGALAAAGQKAQV